MGVRLPIRNGKQNPTLPFDGTTSISDWNGYVPFEQLPSVLNTNNNFLASANNKPISNFKYHISNLWGTHLE